MSDENLVVLDFVGSPFALPQVPVDCDKGSDVCRRSSSGSSHHEVANSNSDDRGEVGVEHTERRGRKGEAGEKYGENENMTIVGITNVEIGRDYEDSLECSTTVHLQWGGKSSMFGASFNFVNSIIGAGIIGIPYALKLCGFYVGVLMLILVAVLVDKSVIMLIEW